jgi:ferritin-like metal-binding protein YciE
MKLKTMGDLFLDTLQDLYDAEKQITKALPKMSKAASSEDLKAAFEEHLEVTRGQVERLERIFDKLHKKPGGKKCAAMEGLIEEGEELVEEGEPSAVLDAGLIGAAQKVEHYEMAGYGTARTFAQILGHTEAAELLQETLDEEKETDSRLTEIAESMVNEEAVEETAE